MRVHQHDIVVLILIILSFFICELMLPELSHIDRCLVPVYTVRKEQTRKTLAQQYSLRDAQAHVKKLVDDAQHGKMVLILDENDRAVQLVPVGATAKPHKAGSARGQIKMASDFDAPLSDFGEYME